MNILLFNTADILEKNKECVRVKISGEPYVHLSKVQKFSIGDELRIGQINGKRGLGKIESSDSNSITLSGTLDQSPPLPARCKLILAMPRPIMLKRILVDIAMLGVKEIVLLHTQHVQKSYWESKVFDNNGLENLLIKGLEQSCDTLLPTVHIEKRFKPFVEDKLIDFSRFADETANIILAHPNSANTCPQPAKKNFTLIVGPEKGFTPYEVDKFLENGAKTYTLGERHLRVETAATYLLGRLL